MIRFGIVGFGLHAEKRLMPGFAGARNCEVSAISRRGPEKARNSAERYGVPEAFSSTGELCNCDRVDAVFVTSPDALHLPDVLRAIGCGKPVLCEKPLAMNGDQARQMVEAARGAGVLLGVAQVFRFERSTRRFRERIAAGDVGRPLLARAEFCYMGLNHPRGWINDPEVACGGPIADVGVHCIDALRFVLQDGVATVHTTAAKDEVSEPFESTAVLTLRFEGGALGSVSVSTRSEYRTLLEVVGEEATLTACDGFSVEWPLTIEYRTGTDRETVEREVVENTDAYTLQVEAFADAVKGGGGFEVPGEEGLANQLVLDAAYASVLTGSVEPVLRG